MIGWLEQEQPQEATPLQLVIEQAKAQPLAAHGEIGNGRKDESRVDLIKSTQGGTSQSYLLQRLARDQPELLDQIGPDKEFRSVRAAAIEAGIIKPRRNRWLSTAQINTGRRTLQRHLLTTGATPSPTYSAASPVACNPVGPR